jgi:HlyD family secretion protein
MDTPRETMDKAIPKKKGIQKKHFGYIAIGLAIVILIYMAFFADRTSTYKVEKDKLIIETVTEDQFNDYITVPGTVEPITTIKLDAQEGGRVEEKLIEEGSMVKKGDVILRLSNPDLYLNILNSEANLLKRKISSGILRSQWNRKGCQLKESLSILSMILKERSVIISRMTFLSKIT